MAEKKTEDVKFYNAQDGIRGRDGGPYADEEDARQREVARARGEGREPDFENLQPTVGQQLVTSRFVEDNLYSNPSMAVRPGPQEKLDDAADLEDAPKRIDPGKLPVDKRDELPDSERKAQQEAVNKASADVTSPGNSGGQPLSSDSSSESKPAASKRAASKRTTSKRTAAKK